MPAERKKLLWISISACVFVLIVLAAGFILLSPKKGSSGAPATIGNSAPPKAQDPQDFLSSPPPAPSIEQPRAKDGNMIIVYGDNPSASPDAQAKSLSAPASSAAPSAAAQAEATAGAADESAAAAPTAAPAASTAKPAATAKAVAKPQAAKPAKTAAKPSSTKAAAAKVEEFWIQAGAFQSRGRADELKQSLAEKGIAALITVQDISGKNFYRVRVGPYGGKAEAEGWLGRLKELPGCEQAYVSKSSVSKPKK
jgi:cell division septation protein DedD